MKEPIDVVTDVSTAAALGTEAHTVATVHLPDGLSDPPVICFAFPGGGYGRRYWSFDMPGSTVGGQAGFHTSRGWVFVSCDHLGVGDSTIPEGSAQTLEISAAANNATVEHVLAELRAGSYGELAGVERAIVLGIGQSMGGNFLIVQQGQHHTFDGVGILGFSGIHTIVPSRPGSPPAAWPWVVRGSALDAPIVTNAAAMAAAAGPQLAGQEDLLDAAQSAPEHPFAYAFHFDDEPAEIVEEDLFAGADDDHPWPAWRSPTTPVCAILGVSPGIVAPEAAAITVPVLVAVGERDVVPDPAAEPKAYKSSPDVTVYVCPRMAHMHNFATTREQFWARIHAWGTGVATTR